VNAWSDFFVAELNHFSPYGASATNIVDVAPLLDGRLLDLHSGASTFGIPIAVPPGRGGFSPNLDLSYSSARLGEMRSYGAASSWAGVGFDLDTPSIQFAYDPGDPADVETHMRAFLSLGASGGEILRDGTDKTIWRATSEEFLKIRSCVADDPNCEWTVWDKNGTKYVFGAGTEGTLPNEYRRYYWDQDAGNTYRTEVYRLDLSYAVDVLGNTIDYKYWQHLAYDPFSNQIYTKAAYPKTITYNGGEAQIVFNNADFDSTTTWDVTRTNDGNPVSVRYDTPYNVQPGGSCPLYRAPLVQETRKLRTIDAKVSGQIVRRYNLNYTTEQFAVTQAECGPAGGTATAVHKLNSISMTDPNLQSYNFTTTTFTYINRSATRHGFEDGLTDYDTYNLPHIGEVANGFGGAVQFHYVETGVDSPGQHWTRQVVDIETHVPGAGQPSFARTIAYSPATPELWVHPNPTRPNDTTFHDAIIHGFSVVTETDADNNQIVHKFLTNEIRAGMEYETTWLAPGAVQWQKSTTNWVAYGVANQIAASWGTQYWVNFIYPSYTDTWLKGQADADRNHVVMTFDLSNGNRTQTYDYGNFTATGDSLITNVGYTNNTTAWIFKPKFEEMLDPDDGNKLLSCKRMYYDGAKNINATPVHGLITAQSQAIDATGTACNSTASFPASTNTYSVFDSHTSGTKSYGTLLQGSVPTDVEPEDAVNASQTGQWGWISCVPGGCPTLVKSASTSYDSVHHIFPVSQTDPMGMVTTMPQADWDFVVGKPKKIVEPNGHTTNIAYDALGRTDKSWDNGFDSSTYPTVKYTYTWGTLPNITQVDQRVEQGTTIVHSQASCMDGFGREIEAREHFQNGGVASTRTDYNSRGLFSARANPVTLGSSFVCGTPPASISSADRMTYLYDPLGNVTVTDFYDDSTWSARTVAEYKGLESTICDEDHNKTRNVSNPTARTLTVHEPAAAASDCTTTVASNPTVYTYNKLGALRQVDDALGNRSLLNYDMLGRKTSMHDPDMGDWSYKYNAAGSLIEQTDEQGIVTTLKYDALERLTEKSYSGGPTAADVTYFYDSYPSGSPCTGNVPAGSMTRMTDPNGTQHSCYDGRKRETKVSRQISGDSTTYQIDRTYYANGAVKDLTYPADGSGRETVTYDIDTSGQLESLTSTSSPWTQTFVTDVSYKPQGAPSIVSWGNTLSTTYGYDFRLRSNSIVTSGSTQNLTLTYDDASNVETVTDGTGTSETVTYVYDELNRLVSASGFAGSQTANYSYDAIGNLRTKQEGTSNFTLYYPTPGLSSTMPHAVTSTTGTLARAMAYDVNGNLRHSVDRAYDFDEENRLSTVVASLASTTTAGALRCIDFNGDGDINSGDQGPLAAFVGTHKVPNAPYNGKFYNASYDFNTDKHVSSADQGILGAAIIANPPLDCPTTVYRYIYDGNGALLKRDTFDRALFNATATDSIVYIGGIFEKNTVTNTTRKYYQALGRTIALRDIPSGGGGGTVRFLLADHLGSTVELADTSGGTASGSKVKYWPYGATRAGTLTGTDKGYTGQRAEPLDSNLGIYNYKARFYSTILGRFLSPDALIQSPQDPQALGRYTYARSSPATLTDPTGRCFMWGGVDLTAVYGCSRPTMLNWLRCGMKGDCGGSSNLNIMARWALRQRDFHDNVMESVRNDDGFRGDVQSIRSRDSRRTQDRLHNDTSYWRFIGAQNSLGLPFPVFATADATVYGFDIDYSYIDFIISAGSSTPSVCCLDQKYAVRLSTMENEAGWRVAGVSRQDRKGGGHSIGIELTGSLFNPDLYSLQVKFDLVLMSAPQALSPPRETRIESQPYEILPVKAW
jgi:RHS repeat-associated protein